MQEIKFRDLRPEEIEVRVGATTKNERGQVTAFTLLLYKTARVDANILDETFGVYGWKNNYYQVKNTMICSVSIWDEDKKQWINKDNGGDDDFTMEQVKAECSDSMKRCCFNLGIGRKLYSASKIYMRVDKDKYQSTEKDYFKVDEIEYDDKGITKLVISNKKTKEVVISYPKYANVSQNAQNEPKQAINEPKGSITSEDLDYINRFLASPAISETSRTNFYNYLDKNFGTMNPEVLTKSQGQEVVDKINGRKRR